MTVIHRFVYRPLHRLLALLCVLLAVPAAHALEIRSIEWTQTQVGAQPAPDAQWTRFDLPLRWNSSEGSNLQGVAVRTTFKLDTQPQEAWAVFITHATNGGRVTVNGRFIGQIRMPDEKTAVRWRRPHLLAIDPALLQTGDNTVLIQTAYRNGAHAIAGIEIGPLTSVAGRYDQQFFFSYTLTWIGATLAAVITLLFGVIWLRRSEPMLGLLTLAAALWVVRSSFFLFEAVPLGAWLWMRVLYYLANGGFAAVMTLTLMRMSGINSKRGDLMAISYAALGPVLLLITNQHAAPYLDQFWMPGLLLITGAAFVTALIGRLRGHDAPAWLILLAMAIAIAAAVHDFLLAGGYSTGLTTLALHWAGPLVLISLATPLVDRFVRILRAAENARTELENRVREREQLLKRNFERLRESERLQAQAQERQRIMQDMHDGLGSQLLSSLMLVERGAVSQDQVAQILRESIDDMRLAIDALAVEDAGLLSALGNLRYRMEPRLRVAGIDLGWTTRGLPEEIDIDPDDVLPILRIVQEALTNSLKHSKARTVQVVIALENAGDAQWLNLRVADNGRGITEEGVGGRGLLNMRSRAQKIGAQLKLETVPGAGTMINLRYKIEKEQMGPTTRMAQQTVLNTQAVIERMREN